MMRAAMPTKLSKSIAEITQDAYMAQDYGSSWERCARLLLNLSLTRNQVEAVLRSKHMRWADDCFGRGNGQKSNSAAFKRYLDNWIKTEGKNWLNEVRELTVGTFGESE